MSLNPLDVLLVPHTVSRASQAFASTAVTLGGTAHVKTGWVQAITATTEDTYMIRLYSDSTFLSATDTSALVDIGIGVLGSEVALVSNLLIGNWRAGVLTAGSSSPVGSYYDIPIFVPKGTRLTVRAQGAQTSVSFAFVLDLFGRSTMHGDPFTGAAIDTIGALTASSHGTVITCGVGSAGSWTQLIAATTAPYRAILIGVDAGGDTAVPTSNCTVDLGVGASGSEQLIVPADYIQVNTQTAEAVDVRSPANHLIGLAQSIPVGTRLAARGSQSTGTGQVLGIAIYGVR